MPQLFVFRTQAIDTAKRTLQSDQFFRTALHEDTGMWKFWYEPGDNPAASWPAAKDYVNHVETVWIDKVKTAALIVTCRMDEIPAEDLEIVKKAGWLIEPITPSLFDKGDDKPEPKARNASTGERAKSDVESPTKLVWQIADSMPGATRKDIIAACVAKGVHPSTASTQYSRWNKART